MNLVLLPGLDGTGILFRPLLAALPKSIKPIVVSYPTHVPLGYADLTKIAELSLPKTEPFVLLGESFGGPLSLHLAAARPENLKGVILCGSFISCPVGGVPKWLAPIVRPLPFRSFPFFVAAQRMLGLYESVEHHALAREAISQVGAHVFAHRVREIIAIDVARELIECKVPMLYMQGSRDSIVRGRNLKRIQTMRPNIEVARIDSGHMILKTRPVESAKVIAAFIAGLSPR